jgi:hypothetical protein
MDKSALTNWALANGWQMVGDCPSLMKPSSPQQAIVRMVLKAGVVQIEIRKPVGKWEKISSTSYAKITPDPETGFPRGLGLDTISGFSMLMQANKNRMVFAKKPEVPDPGTSHES